MRCTTKSRKNKDSIRYNPQTPKKLEPMIKNVFLSFVDKWGRNIIGNKKVLSFNKKHFPNHACIFNNLEFVGKPCTLIATDEEFCLVTFDGNLESAQFYRCEDIEEEGIKNGRT